MREYGGREINDLESKYIYWESHTMPRDKFDQLGVWLNNIAENVVVLRLVRNCITRNGSKIKGYRESSEASREKIFFWCFESNKRNAECRQTESILIRFEDLKQWPNDVLRSFCNKTGLPWSDTMLDTTCRGKRSEYLGVTGFDLKPVYNTYEEYFSAFDRFCISVISYEMQKKYGYPYTSILNFTREELQEMFRKDLRAFSLVARLSDEEEAMQIFREQRWIRHKLQKLWKYELQEKWENERDVAN